jgi:hypothetical protein
MKVSYIIKDTANVPYGRISHHIGHIKDVKDMSENNPHTQPSSRILLDHRAFGTFFEQKVGKIAHALYLITSHVPENEPIRMSLRSAALQMIASLHSSDLAGGASMLGPSFEPIFASIASYLSIAKQAGYISETNASILSSEIESLRALVSDGEGGSARGLLLSKNFFAVPAALPPRISKTEEPPIQKDTSESTLVTNGSNGHSENGRKEKKTKLTRRDKILSLFKDKKNITINDVEKIIEGCSKKTMQRELLSLVDEGILTKQGEKRWSVYTLVPTREPLS